MRSSDTQKKFSLVLGGGGARGFFHIGVIKGLQELHIPITEIAGTSIGALIGAMYAASPTQNFEESANEVNFIKLIHALFRQRQDQDSQELTTFIKNYINKDYFEDLSIPFSCNATDINARQEIIFNSGKLIPAIIASISLPGIFPPAKHNDAYLFDGGLINNVPVSLIKQSSHIIISDITGPFKPIDKDSNIIDILYSSYALMQQTASLNALQSVTTKHTYLQLEDDSISIMDFRKNHFQKLIDIGYQTILSKRSELVR